jgi:hypothetical protein
MTRELNISKSSVVKRKTDTPSVSNSISRAFSGLVDAKKKIDFFFTALGTFFADVSKSTKALEAGWVPFKGMPCDDMSLEWSMQDFDTYLSNFTADKWPSIRSAFTKTVKASGVDQEAIETFQEALLGYEQGNYRSVVRVLFPEIERVARESVYGGSRQEDSAGRRGRAKMNTSLRDYRHAVRHELPAGLAMHSTFGFTLTNKMDEHLYTWVGEDEVSLSKFRDDPIPNRHASMHGYVPYSSRKNAFNTIAMAAFMFESIMQINLYLDENTSSQSAAS